MTSKTQVMGFLFVFLSSLHVGASPTVSGVRITDQNELEYQLSYGGLKEQRKVPLSKIGRIYHEVELIPVEDSYSPAVKESLRLRNLEASWINGKHFVYIEGKRIEVSLAQTIEIVRKQQNPQYQLGADERANIQNRINEISAAVDKMGEAERKQIEGLVPKKQLSSTDVHSVVQNAVAKGGRITTLLLDGLPYFLTPLPSNPDLVMEVVLSNEDGNVQANLASSEIGECNLPTVRPRVPNTGILKLQGSDGPAYYATWESVAVNFLGNTDLVVIDTPQGNSYCSLGSSSRIFKNGFEGTSGVQ